MSKKQEIRESLENAILTLRGLQHTLGSATVRELDELDSREFYAAFPGLRKGTKDLEALMEAAVGYLGPAVSKLDPEPTPGDLWGVSYRQLGIGDYSKVDYVDAQTAKEAAIRYLDYMHVSYAIVEVIVTRGDTKRHFEFDRGWITAR